MGDVAGWAMHEVFSTKGEFPPVRVACVIPAKKRMDEPD